MSKGLEALEKLTNYKCSRMSEKIECKEIIEKELKALEILKKEPFISANWYLEGTYEEYVNAIEVVKITKDEWNIAKEVLK